MSFSDVADLVGWVAVLLGTTAAYVQFSRSRRRGVEGVSLATWMLFVVLALFWTVYGFSVHSWQMVLGSALALPVQVMIVVQLRPWSAPVVLRSWAVALVCCGVPALAWGWTGAVLGAGAAGTLTRLPQLMTLVRIKGAVGVSVGSWLVSVSVSALWVLYYVGARLWAVLVVTALAGGVSLAIASLAGWRHYQVRTSTLTVAREPRR